MPRPYCPAPTGKALLTATTGHDWHAIAPNGLHPRMCVATILSNQSTQNSVFPIRDQYCYFPQALKRGPAATTPEQLYRYLQTTCQEALKVIPSVKYDLEGVRIPMVGSIFVGTGFWLIEGSMGLMGDLVVKGEGSSNPLTFSLNDKNSRLTLNTAEQERNNFLSSLKISGFDASGKPTLTIGSSITDKVWMTSSSVKLIMEGSSAKIVASFTPHYYEIKTRSGLILEVQIGYEFTGKGTFYPNPPDPGTTNLHSLANGLTMIGVGAGIVILAALAAPEVLIGGAIAGGLVMAGS